MYKVEKDELFSTFENELDTLVNLMDQRISFMQAQASMSQQAFDFEEVHYLNYNGVISFNPTIMCQTTITRVGRHMRISPMGIQVFKVKKG